MTTNNPSNQSRSQKQNFLAIAVTVGVILLAVIGFLAYNNVSKGRQLELTTSELDESSKLRKELEDKYNQAVADLEGQKTSNAELNAMIDQQKADLEAQKNKIAGLLGSKEQLGKARAEIASLTSKANEYLAEIQKLKSENEALMGENTQLTTQRDSLGASLQSKSAENEALSSAKAQLVSEKEALSGKVNIASVIKMKSITAVGQKVKGSGKVKDENSAKSVEQLKICFTTMENEVTKAGPETFHVRIVDPRGETIAVESMGSGMATNKKTGEEFRYTKAAELNYDNGESNECVTWTPTTPSFTKGKYTVEIYNKGYLSGTKTFELK